MADGHEKIIYLIFINLIYKEEDYYKIRLGEAIIWG